MVGKNTAQQAAMALAQEELEDELSKLPRKTTENFGAGLSFSGSAAQGIAATRLEEVFAELLHFEARFALTIDPTKANWFGKEILLLKEKILYTTTIVNFSNASAGRSFLEILENYKTKLLEILKEQGLGNEYLRSAQAGDDQRVRELLDHGVDVNFQDPRTQATALHLAAAASAKSVIDELCQEKKIIYLVLDAKGRLPSSRAFEIADDAELGQRLMSEEIAEAKMNNLDYRAILTGEIEPPNPF